MSNDIINKTIDYLINMQNVKREKIFISFNGGECLLYPEKIKKILDSLPKENFYYNIYTNGTILDDSIIQIISQYNTTLTISVDGAKISHNKNRCFIDGRGSYDIISNNLNIITSYVDKSKITISMVVSHNTVNEMYENYYHISEILGMNNITISFSLETIKESDLSIIDYQFQLISNKYKEKKFAGHDIYLNIIHNYISNINYSNMEGFNCGICKNIAILPTGDIIPCGSYMLPDTEYIIGHINNKIYNFECYIDKNFNISQVELDDCIKCKLNSRCMPICFVNNVRLCNNPFKIPDIMCSLNQIYIKHVDQIIYDIYQFDKQLLYNILNEEMRK